MKRVHMSRPFKFPLFKKMYQQNLSSDKYLHSHETEISLIHAHTNLNHDLV